MEIVWMEFRQLQLFVAVAEELHFGRAAQRVGMAQPPFSQQIRRLEDELGVRLLLRTSRRVSLTSAGLQVLDDARELLSRRADLKAAASRAANGETGMLRLGFAPSSAFGILPDIIRQFRTDLPEVRLLIEDHQGFDIASSLLSGDLDLAIVRGPFRHPAVVAETLLREPLMLAASTASPLLALDVVPLEALADEPFVLFPRAVAPGLYDVVTSACLAAGFSPNVVQEAASWSSVVSLVDAGLGVTLAPASASALCPKGVSFRLLGGSSGEAEIALAYADRTLSPAAARFRTIAKSASMLPAD